jgi:hypothetical protein
LVRKTGLLFCFYLKTHFQIIFDIKHPGTLVNQSMAPKDTKIAPKSKTNSKQKNVPEFRYVFVRVFKVKKAHNLNFPRHTELFDTKINCFGG